MFEIDESSLPFVRTRHALLALDLQNDFACSDAPLSTTAPPNFVDNILNLASNFRSSGNVIWVRTVFEASRPVNSGGGSESVITDAELPAARRSTEEASTRPRPSQRVVERYAKLAKANGGPSQDATEGLVVDVEGQISETYLTLEPGEGPLVVSPMSPGSNLLDSVACSIDAKRDLVFQKTYYSAFKDGSLVQTLRAKFVTEIYICGALTNISVFATAMDAARHGYAITIVDDCLGYRSKARHDEALQKLVEFTGCDIISSASLIRDIKERERAQRPPPGRNVRPKARDPENIEALMANLNLRPDGSTAPRPSADPTGPAKNSAVAEIRDSSESLASSDPAEEMKLLQRTASTDVKRERVKTKIKSRRRHSKAGAKDKDAAVVREAASSSIVDKVTSSPSPKTSAATSQESVNSPEPSRNAADTLVPRGLPEVAASLEVEESPVKTAKGKGKAEVKPPTADLDDQIEKMAKVSVKDGSKGLCEGDTTIIHDLLDNEAAEGIFERIRDEVRWQKMSHQGGDVPRLVAVQGEIGEDGSIPIYRHPADESPPLLQFSAVVSQIRERVEEKLGHPVNHVLIQFYRDGNDYISEHSDKTLDIVLNTFIANVSLGAQRTMVFRTKKQQTVSDGSKNDETIQPRQATRAPLPHNSMCRMGLVTNMHWLHGIRPDKRMTSEKSADELAFNGGRISLTFRKIGTFLSKDQQKIWGQGAIAKTKKDARTVINGDNAESEKMIRAFGKENHSSEFNWKEQYGGGFDVLHIENSPKLFLSGDKVADLRVKLLLAEYGIEWTEGSLSPSFNWKNGSSARDAPPIPEDLPVKFVDNDLSKSTVVGDLAIMLYLDCVYGAKSAMKPKIDLARQFTRLQQTGELLTKWRTTPFSLKPFRRELQLWETFAAEGPFIAGEKLSLADYALWPLLDEIHGEWDTFDGLKNLAAYYARLSEPGTLVKALCSEEKCAKDEMPETKVETKEENKNQKSDMKKDEKKLASKGKKTP